VAPREARSSASPERIVYAFADSSVGRILAAESDAGLVWLSFAENDTAALDELAHHCPRAELLPAENAARWLAPVVAAVDNPASPMQVPLDMRGTEFQRAVWEALLRIPAGETRSYSEIAREIGRPAAVRAVAQACGANPVALLVPCHRVIGADGSLTGYASGLDRKRQLLEREGWSAS